MYDFTASIVTYNTEKEELRRIIGCFQRVGLEFKLWISDNSEEAGLKEFVKEISDDRIEYIFNNCNKGFGAGHNVIINKLITGEVESEFHLMIKETCSYVIITYQSFLIRNILHLQSCTAAQKP